MRIITNDQHIRRYARIGQFTSLGGLVLLVAGLIISFTNVEQVALSLGALLFGFALSQVGIFLGNRYARFPRPDQAINLALKGLDKRHTIYHYVAPTAHMLAGPSGIWVLIPKPQRGRITYEKGRWRQKGGLGLAYMRIFAQEGIGRPDLEIGAEIESVRKFLAKEIPDVEFPDINAVLVFTNDKAEVDADDAPIATLPLKKVKEHIRKAAKEKGVRLTPEQISALQDVLESGIQEAADDESGDEGDEE